MMKMEDQRHELAGKTRRDLMPIATELKIVNRHRMKKDDLIEAIELCQIYRSLPESPEILHDLTKRDLIKLCELFKIKAGISAPKIRIIKAIQATVVEKHPIDESYPVDHKPLPKDRIEELPSAFGETFITLLPIDPNHIHVYWDIAEGDIQKAKKSLGRSYPDAKAILRFYDITQMDIDTKDPHHSFDLDIELQTKNLYVDLWSPEETYIVDLGLVSEKGEFFPIVRSETVRTPPASISLKVEKHPVFVEQNYKEPDINLSIGADKGPSFQQVKNVSMSPAMEDTVAEIKPVSLEKEIKNHSNKQNLLLAGKPVKEAKKRNYVDLTEICEKTFVSGISSKS